MFPVVAGGSDGDRHARRSVARGLPGAGSSRYDPPDADRDGLVLDPALQGVPDGAHAGDRDGPRAPLSHVDDAWDNRAMAGGVVRFALTPRFTIGPEVVYLRGRRGSHEVTVTLRSLGRSNPKVLLDVLDGRGQAARGHGNRSPAARTLSLRCRGAGTFRI